MKLLLMLLLLNSLAEADNLVRVKVLNASEVSDEYLGNVISNVRHVYRNDLRVRLRVRVSRSNLIDHSHFILIEDRFNEFVAYAKILKKRPYWNRVTFVALPPYYDESGCNYGSGLATWFATGVIRQWGNCNAGIQGIYNRFGSDETTIEHELCHTIAYNRRRFGFPSRCDHIDSKPNIMHSAALQFTPTMDLRFLKATKREINL